MEAWEATAREAIRDLIARYNTSGDAGRLDELLTLFCDDAVFDVNGRARNGVGEIRAMFEAVAEATRKTKAAAFVRHFTATHQIDVRSRSEASGQCYYQVLTDRGLDHWGRYVDEYRCDGDRWRFQSRSVTIDGLIEGSWAARVGAEVKA